MNHLYKTITTTAVPLLLLLRQRIADLIGAHDWYFEIDIAIFLALAVVTVVMWCICLGQLRDVGLRLVFVGLIVYATVLATHVALIMLSLMYNQHPDWQQAVIAALSKQFVTFTMPVATSTERK